MSTTRTLSVELPDFVADALQNRAERNGTTPTDLPPWDKRSAAARNWAPSTAPPKGATAHP
jgi:hypothetical protein